MSFPLGGLSSSGNQMPSFPLTTFSGGLSLPPQPIGLNQMGSMPTANFASPQQLTYSSSGSTNSSSSGSSWSSSNSPLATPTMPTFSSWNPSSNTRPTVFNPSQTLPTFYPNSSAPAQIGSNWVSFDLSPESSASSSSSSSSMGSPVMMNYQPPFFQAPNSLPNISRSNLFTTPWVGEQQTVINQVRAYRKTNDISALSDDQIWKIASVFLKVAADNTGLLEWDTSLFIKKLTDTVISGDFLGCGCAQSSIQAVLYGVIDYLFPSSMVKDKLAVLRPVISQSPITAQNPMPTANLSTTGSLQAPRSTLGSMIAASQPMSGSGRLSLPQSLGSTPGLALPRFASGSGW